MKKGIYGYSSSVLLNVKNQLEEHDKEEDTIEEGSNSKRELGLVDAFWITKNVAKL